MPKRKRQEEIEVLKRRLKKLRRRRARSSSSSSDSTCSQCSSSSSSSAEAASINPDNQNDRVASARALNVLPPPPGAASARNGHSDVLPTTSGAARPVEVEPVATRLLGGVPTVVSLIEKEPVVGTSRELPANPVSMIPGIMEPIEVEDDDDNICQAEILEILGVDPSQAQEFGEDINKDVASRFDHITSSGLEKSMRQELINKLLVPANCKKLDAPQLNAEIKTALGESAVKRDSAIESRQKMVAAAITGVGRILTSQLKSKDKDNNISKQLMEVGRLLCDIQHNDSSARRKLTMYSLKKDIRDQLANTKIDKYLFGEDLPETLKTAKAVSKSSTDIKMDSQKPKHAPSKFPKHLNWKSGPSARSQPKGPTQKHQSAASSNRRYGHGNSSHRSSHRGRHTRRR